MAGVRLSIVIVNWNTRDLLRACLESMRPHLMDSSFEIVVVDNASQDGSGRLIETHFPSVTLIQMRENVGFSRANNAGIRATQGQYLLLLNSDTEVREDAFEKMCDYLDANPNVGVLGAQLLNPNGSLQASCRTFPSYRTAFFHRNSFLSKVFPRNRYSSGYLMTSMDRTKTMEVDWVMGACLMTRREVLERVGLLDEAFFMYAEDVDWCYRIKQAGWTVVYFPEAKIMHHYESSARKAPFRMNVERHRSMWHFYKKHYSRGVVLLDVATALGILLRMIYIATKNMVYSITGAGNRQ